MMPTDIDQRIQKARQLGVPEEIIQQRISQKYPEYNQRNFAQKALAVVHNNPIAKFLIEKGTNVAQDINAGIVGKLTEKTRTRAAQQAFDTAASIESQAANEVDPVRKKSLLQKAASLYKNVSDSASTTRGTYSEDVYQNPAIRGLEGANQIVGAANLPSTIKSGVNLATKAGRILSAPKQAIGRAIEQKATDAGTIPSEVLKEQFGTFNAPNPKLYEGISTASGKGDLMKVIKSEIFNQGRSAGGGIAEPSYKDILNYRKGAYTAAKYAKGVPQTSEQKLYANIGRAYDAILKAGAGTGRLDKAYSWLSKIENIAKPTKNVIKYAIMYKAAETLLNKAIPKN